MHVGDPVGMAANGKARNHIGFGTGESVGSLPTSYDKSDHAAEWPILLAVPISRYP